jgi:hypothetical protein
MSRYIILNILGLFKRGTILYFEVWRCCLAYSGSWSLPWQLPVVFGLHSFTPHLVLWPITKLRSYPHRCDHLQGLCWWGRELNPSRPTTQSCAFVVGGSNPGRRHVSGKLPPHLLLNFMISVGAGKVKYSSAWILRIYRMRVVTATTAADCYLNRSLGYYSFSPLDQRSDYEHSLPLRSSWSCHLFSWRF